MEKYQLKEKSYKRRDVFIVTIKADSNDADYVTEVSTYCPSDFNEWVINDLIRLVRDHSGSHELEDFYGDIDTPYNEYSDTGQCHTLVELEVEYIDKDGTLWDVEINSDAEVPSYEQEYLY